MPDFDPAEYVRKIFGMYPDDLCTVELLRERGHAAAYRPLWRRSLNVTAEDGHFKAIVE